MTTPTLPPLPEPDSYCTFKDSHDYDVFSAEQMHAYATTYGQACAEAARAELVAEVERLRADAKRYRWLRDSPDADPSQLLFWQTEEERMLIDAAIDSAMKGESK